MSEDSPTPPPHGSEGAAADDDPAAVEWVPGLVYQALATRDWDLAAQLVEEHWPLLISHHLSVVRAAAEALPEDFLRLNPRWITVRQYVGNLLMSPQMRPNLYPRPRRVTALRPLDVLTQLTESSFEARSRGDYERAIAMATRGLEIARTEPSLNRGGQARMLPALLFHLGLTFELAASEEEAMTALQETYTSAVRERDLRAAADSSGELAWIHTLAGRGEQAERWIGRHLAVTASSPAIPQLRSTIHLAIACRLHDRLERERALEELDRAKGTGMDEHWLVVTAQRVIFSAFSQRHDTWELLGLIDAQVAGSMRQATGRGINRFVLDYARAVALCNGGQPEAALPLLDAAVRDGGDRFVLSRRASALYSLGEFAAAERDADKVMRSTRVWPRSLVEGLVVKAGCSWRKQGLEDAAGFFRQAVQLALANQLLVSLAVVPPEDYKSLCRLAFGEDCPVELEQIAMADGAFGPPVLERAGLTAQEERVMSELSRGGTIHIVASRLQLSQNIVKAHTRSIYRKLGVNSREEMISEAFRRGLLHG